MYMCSFYIEDIDEEDDDDNEGVGAEAPPLTEHIANILRDYPPGGQILKVSILHFDCAIWWFSYVRFMCNLRALRS